MKYNSVRGMEDMLPQDAWLWRELESTVRRELESYGYQEIRTPILEETSVFVRGIGETTDIVTKEMYTFMDRKSRSLTMRPEGTAPIVRSYIEHSLLNVASIMKLYYVGPMFRAERPQKGRLRQFHQIGVEIIGSNSVYADIEAILQMDGLLKALGVKDFNIKINTLGCKSDKIAFSENLKKYLDGKRDGLCEDCRGRIDKNVLRVLDCKSESCRAVVSEAPDVLESICEKCKENFNRVKIALKEIGIKTEEARNLVRGLDYYTGIVFEVTNSSLGSQDAIGAGGRYDTLVKDMGGPNVGAVGFALGIERLIIVLKNQGRLRAEQNVIYIATLGDAAKFEGIKIARDMKNSINIPGLAVLTDIGENSLKSQMRSADKSNAKIVIILGEDELKNNMVTIKDMKSDNRQVNIEIKSIIEEVRKMLC